MPSANKPRPNQAARLRPNLCTTRELSAPAIIDATPIAVPCNPATVNEVP